MQTDLYFSFVLAAAVIIVVPGPTNLAIVADALSAGLRRSLWTVAGAALSHAAFIAVATAGIAALLGAYPNIFIFLKWFGVLYLAFQGFRLVIKKSPVGEQQTAPQNGKGPGRHLLRGFLVNSTNPKALLFYAALFPPFVNSKMAYLPQLLTLSVTFLAIFLVVGSAHAVLAQKARDALGKQTNLRLVNKVSGSVMIGAAVWMATK